MPQVIIFDIDLIIGCYGYRTWPQIQAKMYIHVENVILDHILEVLQRCFQKLDISTGKYQKDILIFCVSCYHLSSI